MTQNTACAALQAVTAQLLEPKKKRLPTERQTLFWVTDKDYLLLYR